MYSYAHYKKAVPSKQDQSENSARFTITHATPVAVQSLGGMYGTPFALTFILCVMCRDTREPAFTLFHLAEGVFAGTQVVHHQRSHYTPKKNII